jgi:hypothetical protein
MQLRVVADERRRGKIERQLLDGGIEQELRIALDPARHALLDAGVQLREIRFHWCGFERDRQRLAVQPVLVEIEQHQPAREKQPEDGCPTHLGGEQPLLIEEDELVRLGTKQGDAVHAEQMIAIDGPVCPVHPLDVSDRIAERFQGVADDRPALLAGNMSEILFAERRDACGAGRCLCCGERH